MTDIRVAVSRDEIMAIQTAIARYAEAYEFLQALEESSPLLPTGDQKTGVVGEFYVRLYLEARHPDAVIRFGGHSQPGWDFEVVETTNEGSRVARVQVKTASAFAKGRGLSPIHPGWDQLFVLYLGRDLTPRGVWMLDDPTVCAGAALRSGKCPDPTTGRGGTGALAFGPNRVDEFLAAVKPLLGGTK